MITAKEQKQKIQQQKNDDFIVKTQQKIRQSLGNPAVNYHPVKYRTGSAQPHSQGCGGHRFLQDLHYLRKI